MALAYESNTDLAYDTDVLKQAGKDYLKIADDLRSTAKELDNLLNELKATGWTTPAGTAFADMVSTNWSENIEKYASLLETLNRALSDAATDYDELTEEYIRKTTVKV